MCADILTVVTVQGQVWTQRHCSIWWGIRILELPWMFTLIWDMMMQRQNCQESIWQALPKAMLAENRHNGRKWGLWFWKPIYYERFHDNYAIQNRHISGVVKWDVWQKIMPDVSQFSAGTGTSSSARNLRNSWRNVPRYKSLLIAVSSWLLQALEW